MATKQLHTNRVVASPFSGSGVISGTVPTTKTGEPKHATFIEKLQIKPHEQRRIPLGSFTEENQPKGFLVQVDPDPAPFDSIVSEVVSLSASNRFTLFMQVANYGAKSVNAEIWRL
ncbi:MAG TPA: hypothetical protein VLF69_04325 [Candidatus Saccharimonadales bacterium]|nr:hypothetical protein [Candidatus Saccharimonadales bacterium]